MQDEPRPGITIFYPSPAAAIAAAAIAEGPGATPAGSGVGECVNYSWHDNYGIN